MDEARAHRAAGGQRAKAAQVVLLVALAWLIACAGITTVSAYTVLGASFSPDHGPSGSRITVGELPLAIGCPAVDVWLAPVGTRSPPIDSRDDPRLIQLRGTSTHPPATIGAGLGTTFVFRVPAIAPKTYGTYYQCIGATAGFDFFSAGHTTFTVDPSVPGTDTVAAPASPVTGPPWALIGVFVLSVATMLRRLGRPIGRS